MFCGQCGEFVSDANKFCSRCGAPVCAQFSCVNRDDYYVVITTAEDVDQRNHREMVDTIKKIKSGSRILVDLSNVKFIDSVGIGSLVTLVYSGVRKGQSIKIVIKSRDVAKAIRSLGVDNILEIYEIEEEAVAGWGISARK